MPVWNVSSHKLQKENKKQVNTSVKWQAKLNLCCKKSKETLKIKLYWQNANAKPDSAKQLFKVYQWKERDEIYKSRETHFQ